MLEAVGSPIVGFAIGSLSNNAGLGFLAAIGVVVTSLSSVWIGATTAAPYRQRDEARINNKSLRSELTALSEPHLRLLFRSDPPYQYIARKLSGLGIEVEISRRYSIGIENLCKTSIYGVEVQIVHMKGITQTGRPVDDPSPFTIQLDDTGGSNPIFAPFTVNPGPQGIRYVHVISKSTEAGAEIIPFAMKPPLPPGDYVFTLSVSGQDVTTIDGPTEFSVGVSERHELLFEPLTSC